MSTPGSSAEQTINRALAARDAGRPETSLAPLRPPLRAEPGNARLWQTLAGMYRALEESAAAIEAYARAAALAPGDVKPLHGIAQASLEAGRPATALFDAARQLAPGDGGLLIGRSAAQLAEGQGNTAIADLDALLMGNPLWVDGWATLARLRWQLGQADAFDAGFARALAAAPRSRELWLAWIAALIEVEAWARAAAVVERAAAVAGPSEALTLIAAGCASELGEVARADALFAQLAGRRDADQAEALVRHQLRNGRIDAATRSIDVQLNLPGGERLWPYASLAWRLTGDARVDWLERDGALVAVRDLALGDLRAPLAEYLRSRHHAKAAPAGQSVRAGTQTDGPLFALEAPEIRQLSAAVLAAVHDHAAMLGTADPRHPTLRHVGKPLRFAGSWSVRLTGAGHHSNHIHSQGWISSALYIAVPEQTEMGPAPNGWLQLGQGPASLGLDLPPQRLIEPAPARLVLFPSWLWHGTQPIAGGERLSVAFDVATVG